MNRLFWVEVQKSWRITASNEDKQLIQETASSVALDWGTTIISKPYSNNPLDDFEADIDDEDY